MPGAMAEGLTGLIGRAMVDADFLATLQRTPEAIFDEYALAEAERDTVRKALARLADTPAHRRAVVLRSELRRVAT